MKVGFSNRNFDTVMVMDAILISLACVLVILAYREIAQAPFRHATDMAHAILTVTDDFSSDQVLDSGDFDENGTLQLERRYISVVRKVREAEPGAEMKIFSTHPLLESVTTSVDPFRARAMAKFKHDDGGDLESFADVADGDFIRVAEPIRAFRDCIRCEIAGIPAYRAGDVIGLREVSLPIGDNYAQTIKKLLYACGLLASALMVFLGLIIPVFKRNRRERAQISDLALSFEQQAVTDPMTGLHNRRYFERALESYLKEFNNIGKPLGLMLLDLDHFKQINDTHGHDWGDVVLKEVALRLKAITREDDVVARIGGEEFAVITPYASQEKLVGVAERYRESIEALRIDVGNIVLRPTISVGVATNAEHPDDIEELFKAADRKLYEAKHNGRNRVAA